MKGLEQALNRVLQSENSRLASRMGDKEQCRFPSTSGGCKHFPMRFLREKDSVNELATDLVMERNEEIVDLFGPMAEEIATVIPDVSFITSDGTVIAITTK